MAHFKKKLNVKGKTKQPEAIAIILLIWTNLRLFLLFFFPNSVFTEKMYTPVRFELRYSKCKVSMLTTRPSSRYNYTNSFCPRPKSEKLSIGRILPLPELLIRGPGFEPCRKQKKKSRKHGLMKTAIKVLALEQWHAIVACNLLAIL